MTSPQCAPTERLLWFRRGAFLLLALLAVYASAWPGSFVWDDDVNLLENPLVQGPDALRRIWLSSQSIEYYPLYYSSLRLQWLIFGSKPAPYIGVNLALHLLNTLLVWRILGRLGIRSAGWAAVFFAWHPAAVHAVAWVSQHKTVLSTTFYGASVLLALRAKERESARSAGGALLFFIAGLLAKPTLVFLPIFLLAVESRGAPTSPARLLKWYGPWLLAAGAVGVLRVFWGPTPDLGTVNLGLSAGWRALAMMGCNLFYSAWIAFVPLSLRMLYPVWNIAAWSPGMLLPALTLALGLFALWQRRRLQPNLWLGAAYSVLALLPVSGLFKNSLFAFSPVANHWLYPALPGFMALVAGGLGAAAARWPAWSVWWRRWIPAALALALAGLSAREASRFRDPVHFYQQAVRENFNNVIAHHNLANLCLAQGDEENALRHYRQAVRIHPDLWQARIGAAKLLTAQGAYDAALVHLEAARAVVPDEPEVYFRMGVLHGQAGRPAEAIPNLERALALNDADPVAWNNLGVARFQLDNAAGAAAAFEQALRLDPSYAAAAANLDRARRRLAAP